MRILGLCGVLLLVGVAYADVDLEWRSETQDAQVGETVRIGLYAVADNAGQDEPFSLAEVLVFWDEGFLELQGVVDDGPYSWMFSGFPNDSGLDNLNGTFADGDAYYQAWATFGDMPVATPDGLLITTFKFTALATTSGTEIDIVDVFGSYSVTAVYDDEYGGWNIVDELGSVTVEVGGEYEIGDLNCDGAINAFDIDPFVLALLGPDYYDPAWPDCDINLADINDDGLVDAFDIDPFVALLMGV
ncbi:MAG: hypothetical protein KKB50_11130 [Planctomycetes bacterium]|nr:hypothetical protein [Planctomycetota bacterium]